MRHYTVEFKLHSADQVHRVFILARNKGDAYDKAVWQEIPKVTGVCPYSVWVAAVTYNNGNYQEFNTFEGNPV